MNQVRTFDSRAVIITLGSHTVTGYAEDTFINIAPVGEGTQAIAGADGEVARSLDNNPLREITLTLLQTSPSNDFLSNLYERDRATGGRGIIPIQVLDLRGTTRFAASQAWVVNVPEIGYGREVGEREWVLQAVSTDTHIGGNESLF